MTAEDPLAAAYDALNHGRPDEALTLAAGAREAEPGERELLEGRAYLDLGLAEAARGALERAGAARGADDQDVRALDAEVRLVHWDVEGAAALLDDLAEEAFDVDWWERRALLADLAGDHARADELLAEALAEVPDLAARPVRIDDAEFDEIVEQALGELPALFQDAVARARVVREPMPWRELAGPDPLATPPDVLGLFVGPTLHDLAEDPGAELPPTIYLFKRNLERATKDRAELHEEIRITLFHEIGHLLGLDEDDVAAMGLA